MLIEIIICAVISGIAIVWLPKRVGSELKLVYDAVHARYCENISTNNRIHKDLVPTTYLSIGFWAHEWGAGVDYVLGEHGSGVEYHWTVIESPFQIAYTVYGLKNKRIRWKSGSSILGVKSTGLCLERQIPVAALMCFVVYVGVWKSIQKYKICSCISGIKQPVHTHWFC